MRAAAGCLALLALAACSSSNDGATIVLVTGGESDTFSRDPAPTQLLVESVDTSGKASTLSKVALPASGTVDLGDVSVTTTASLRVTGFDAQGARLVFGQTLPIDFGALAGVTLDVFVQRTGELARMPSPLSDSRPAPLLAILDARFVLVAGGADPSLQKATQLYDLANLAPLDAPPAMPRAPLSMATAGTSALLVDAMGATWFDFSSSTATDATAPSSGSFAEVAGGATFTAADGTSYVVGATRASGDPTARILVVDPKGSLRFAALTTPRLGAAAAWVEGRGLVVTGGAASAGSGAEVLGPGATNALPLPFPADATTGAGATSLDGSHVLVAGGGTSLRVLDVSCTVSCTPDTWSATLATALVTTQAFAVGSASALVVGEDGSGATHAFLVAPTASQEIALKAPRAHARAVALPTVGVGLVGGAAALESFVAP